MSMQFKKIQSINGNELIVKQESTGLVVHGWNWVGQKAWTCKFSECGNAGGKDAWMRTARKREYANLAKKNHLRVATNQPPGGDTTRQTRR